MQGHEIEQKEKEEEEEVGVSGGRSVRPGAISCSIH